MNGPAAHPLKLLEGGLGAVALMARNPGFLPKYMSVRDQKRHSLVVPIKRLDGCEGMLGIDKGWETGTA